MAETTNGELSIKTAWLPHIFRLLTMACGLYIGYVVLKTQVSDLKTQMVGMQAFKESKLATDATLAAEVKELRGAVYGFNAKLDELLRGKNAGRP